MPELKLTLCNPKTGKCHQRVLSGDEVKRLYGMKIGDVVRGELLDLSGYEFQITGGSDSAGFPMRADLPGIARRRIYAVSGVGLRRLGKGVKQRKTVAGNTVYAKTAQLNLKVLKEGRQPLAQEAEAKVDEAKAEAETRGKGKG